MPHTKIYTNRYPCTAALLEQALRARGMKRQDLAAQLGVDPSIVSHSLNGHWLPRASTLAQMTRILKVAPTAVHEAILQDAPLPQPLMEWGVLENMQVEGDE